MATVEPVADLVRPTIYRVVAVFTLAAALIAAGCETSSSTAVLSSGPTDVKCQVTLDAPPLLDAAGGSSAVTVTTLPECAWTASTSASWITGLSPASGQGNGRVSFRASANDGSSGRDATIVVNDEQARVSQRAPCRYTLSPASQTIAASGGSSRVTLATTAECAWTAAADGGWLSLTPPASGTGEGVINFTVPPNDGGERSAAIVVAGQRATVTQSAQASQSCNTSISPDSQSVQASGGSGTIAVQAPGSCEWTVAATVPWIAVTSESMGRGDGRVAFTVAANTGAPRVGTISVGGRNFTVSQAGAAAPACAYSISPTSQSVGAAVSTGTVNVTTAATCAWTAAGNAGWLTVTSGASGTGSGTVGFSAAANTGAARTGTLTIAGQTFTVTQAASAPQCTYSITPTAQAVAANASTTTVAVATAGACAWTASSNAPWIAVTSGASDTGNGSVGLSIAANTGGARTGTATIAGQTFTVNQAAFVAACSYSIAPASQSLPAPGGTATVAVTTTSACAWTSSSGAPWLTVTSGASGTGNGSVGVSVAANTGAARTGTVTIAGQTFTVNQAAFVAACTYSIAPASQSVPAPGGTATVTVTTTSACTWTSNSGVSWIAITSGGSGTGDGSVGLSIAPNVGAARTGTATIAGQTFTVNQAAALTACAFAIAPTSQSLPALGGTGTVTVTTTSTCAWTAGSNAPWLTITSGASGTGSGTVAFSGAINAGAARSGTLTIAGQTFTVTQAGAGGTLSRLP